MRDHVGHVGIWACLWGIASADSLEEEGPFPVSAAPFLRLALGCTQRRVSTEQKHAFVLSLLLAVDVSHSFKSCLLEFPAVIDNMKL